MRIVLLTLSGDPQIAADALCAHYADAQIITIARSALENGNIMARLTSLQKLRPDAFAIMTESLPWQYGQDALMLFGALGGARESAVLDAHGQMRIERRAALIFAGPFRILSSFIRGKFAVRDASRELDRLEQAIKAAQPLINKRNEAQRIAYIRATPSAGT